MSKARWWFRVAYLVIFLGLCRTPALLAQDMPMAPEFGQGDLRWFNTPKPLTLNGLRGRVVILDFWTEGCINCIHIIPILRRIEESFPQEVVVIGVHSPKFDTEKNADSIADAIERYDIRHPIVHDPEHVIWDQFGIEAWPSIVLIGVDGRVLTLAEGEPDEDQFFGAVSQVVQVARNNPRFTPQKLELTQAKRPDSHYLFPGKLKLVPGTPKRWALADGGHHQVVLLDDEGHELARYGSGQPGIKDGAAAEAQFNHPQGLTATNEAIFVADTDNHALRRIDLASGTVTLLAGTGRRGGILGPAAPAIGSDLASPWDIERADDRLIFANAGTHQLGQYDLKTATIARFAGSGAENLTEGPGASAEMAQPSGVSLAPDGKSILVADSESSAIRRVALDPQSTVKTIMGQGLFAFGWKNGPVAEALLQHPLAVTPFGNGLLVADTYNSAIRAIDLASGTVSDFDGGRFTCIDPVCIPTREPAGIVADGSDRVLLVDTGNHRIEEYRPSTGQYHTWSR